MLLTQNSMRATPTAHLRQLYGADHRYSCVADGRGSCDSMDTGCCMLQAVVSSIDWVVIGVGQASGKKDAGADSRHIHTGSTLPGSDTNIPGYALTTS